MNGPAARYPLAVLGGLLLAAATPPAIAPCAEWLVLPALAAMFAVATSGRRPLWCSYLLGALHFACFCWSLRHVLLFAYIAVIVLGGCYHALLAAALQRLRPIAQACAFGPVLAAAYWARANMPEIWYPHGQPCHALWQWPQVLGSAVIGGEALANALLGWIAAAAVLCWRSWRAATPRLAVAVGGMLAALLLAVAATVVGSAVGSLARRSASDGVGGGVGDGAGRAADDGQRAPLRIAAIEPGYHPFAIYDVAPEQRRARWRELFRERLLQPTLQALAQAPPPDLVLWPESSLPGAIDLAKTRVLLPEGLPPSAARLLVGIDLERDGRVTPAAALLALPEGRLLAHQEKQRLVPGGEFLPLLGLLPVALSEWLGRQFERAMGVLPDALPGEPRPPLATAGGTLVGALLCYDNAFPEVAAAQVAAGARCLCVLSNEAWYRGGGELTQLLAITVLRALETATPIVRCTQDGQSAAIGPDGHILAILPLQPSPAPAARILMAELPPGPGRLPPMAWLRGGTGPAAAVVAALLLLHSAFGWARLRSAKTATRAGGNRV